MSAPGCSECGTPLDDVPFGPCATHRAVDEPRRRPTSAAECVLGKCPDSAMCDAMLNCEAWSLHRDAGDLGFVDRCDGGPGRTSIKKSHRAEGRNFVD